MSNEKSDLERSIETRSNEVAITLCDGKYTYIRDDKGQRALRYGEEWRDLIGDGFTLAMAQEIEELQSKQTQFSTDLERRTENYRAALEKIAELARDEDNSLQDILEVAEDALAEDMQERVEPDADLANALHFEEL